MGNTTNLDQWATMERMRFIERSAYWRGTISRPDLAKVFGLSMAQASADLQRYQVENPGGIVYNLNRKRYEGALDMATRFTVPNLEEAMALFLNGGHEQLPFVPLGKLADNRGKRQVYTLPMPQRRAAHTVERRIFMAVLNDLKLNVRYFSVNSGREDWRCLHPRAFAHDGNRWHVRAWCESRRGWADFTMSRIAEANWPEPSDAQLEADPKETREVIRLQAHHRLAGAAKEGVERDFGMDGGKLEVPVTGIVANYLRARLGLPLADGSVPPPLLEEASDPDSETNESGLVKGLD